MNLSSKQTVDVLRAAGEPTRLRILALLAKEELAVLEICRVLDQSQPRVSRHLKLLAEARLVERFPDGAWVFYRLAAAGEPAALVRQVLARVRLDDGQLKRDRDRLDAVQAERQAEASAYFAENAEQWDELRVLYVSDTEVEKAILQAVGQGPFKRLVDLGAGTGRMLTLLAPRSDQAVGLDLSQQMLSLARRRASAAGLTHIELRHGDIFDPGIEESSADLVVVHQVLHFLGDPAAAVKASARLVSAEGRLVIVDFAPHRHEFLREQHKHRRLGFSKEEVTRWLGEAGLPNVSLIALPPTRSDGLTVKIWVATHEKTDQRSAA